MVIESLTTEKLEKDILLRRKCFSQFDEVNYLTPSPFCDVIIPRFRSTVIGSCHTDVMQDLEVDHAYCIKSLDAVFINYRNGLQLERVSLNPLLSSFLYQRKVLNGSLAVSFGYVDKMMIQDLLNSIAIDISNIPLYKREKTAKAFDIMQQSAGTCSIEEVYTSLCLTKEALERYFELTGLCPKDTCRLFRLNALLEMYKNTSSNFTSLAHLLGFYDQSHLVKEFRFFFGTTPKSLKTATFLT